MNDYNTVISFVAMFALTSDLGASAVFIREVARDRSRMQALFGSFFALRAAGSLAMGGAAILAARLMPYTPEVVGYIGLAVVAQVIYQVAQAFAGAFQSVERMEFIAVGTVTYSALYCASSLALVTLGAGVPGLLYAGIVASLAMLALYAFLVQRNVVPVRLDPGWDGMKFLVVAAIPFGLLAALGIVQTYSGRIILSVLRYGEVANYTMTYSFVMVLSLLMTAYMSSVFPLFSRMSGRDPRGFRHACELSFRYLMAITIPMCVGGFLLADRIIYTLYGAGFSGAIPVLRILLCMLPFMVINTVGHPLINARSLERLNIVNAAACAAASLALNLALIPSLGGAGAGIASAVTVALGSMITLYLIRRDLSGAGLVPPLARAAIASAAMGSAILLLDLNNLLLYVLCGAAVYIVAYAAIGGVTGSDVALFKKIARE